ncbi:MAG: hypothetical protein AAGA21_06545 [Pseudomonadota bacterium]
MRFSKTSRSLAWLIIAALLVQPWFGQRAAAKASEAFGTLVICTGVGFEVIRVPVDLMLPDHPAEAPGPHDPAMANCLACLVQALGCLDVAGRIDPPGFYHYWRHEASIADRCLAGPLCRRPLGSRGPPAV